MVNVAPRSRPGSPTTSTRPRRRELQALARRRRRRRAGRPVQRAADLRHRGPARAVARRPERHEPHRGAAGRGRARGLARRPGLRRPSGRRRLRRPARIRRFRAGFCRRSSRPPGSTRGCMPAPAAHARDRVRGAALRRCGRRRGHRVAQPAAGQRLQGLRRRRRADRAARRPRDRGRHPRRRARARHPARRAGVSRCSTTRSSPTTSPRRQGSSATARATCRSCTPRCTASAPVVRNACSPRPGSTACSPVPQQEQPDPDFPTVAFPNPEEPGALDLAFALARTSDADIVIANDPDADRCAVAVPVAPAAGGCCAATRSACCSRMR